MLDIKVRLFGAFRDHASESTLPFLCEPGTRIAELRQKMQQHMQAARPGSQIDSLLMQSVFADEQSILSEDYCLQKSQELAIIPPVCGG